MTFTLKSILQKRDVTNGKKINIIQPSIYIFASSSYWVQKPCSVYLFIRGMFLSFKRDIMIIIGVCYEFLLTFPAFTWKNHRLNFVNWLFECVAGHLRTRTNQLFRGVPAFHILLTQLHDGDLTVSSSANWKLMERSGRVVPYRGCNYPRAEANGPCVVRMKP